jgi:hypothetical protein
MLLAGSLLLSCTTALTPAGSEVRVAKAAHGNCEELDIVYGSGSGGGYTSTEAKMSSAQNELRNKTAELGGNLVVLDAAGGDINGLTISGRAFRCGDEPPTPVRVVEDDTKARTREDSGEAKADPEASAEERLQKLENLREKGLITDEEYDERRTKILDSL